MMTEMLGKQIAVLVVLAGLYGVYSIVMRVTARARRHMSNYRERMRLTEASRLHDAGYHPAITPELVAAIKRLEAENAELRFGLENDYIEFTRIGHDTAARHEAEMNCLKSANKQCRNAIEALMPFLMEDYNGGIMSVDYKAAIELAVAVNDSQGKNPAVKA